MKRIFFSLILWIIFLLAGFSQSKTYVTSGSEMILSFASIEDDGKDAETVLRWTPVINLQSMLNLDVSSHAGLFTGLAVRNVGYIYGNTDPATEIKYKKKFRSYNIGIPLGIKIGNMEKRFIYGGYEVEFPFLYKEKTFEGGDKISKITGWFSKREELIQHGFLVGIQFPHGLNVKFKYYLSEFHNRDYVDAAGNKPYTALKSNIFYFSLNSYLFKNFHYYNPSTKVIQKM